jgi:hypothetical protein
MAVLTFEFSPAIAQDSSGAKFHSRAEYLAERRKGEVAFPELTHALRVLHLPPDKLAQAENILRRYEAETRAARQELQQLVGRRTPRYGDRSPEQPRATDLRSGLQQAKDNLHAEIKAVLTPQQREQLDRYLEKRDPHKDLKSDPGGQGSGAQRGHP